MDYNLLVSVGFIDLSVHHLNCSIKCRFNVGLCQLFVMIQRNRFIVTQFWAVWVWMKIKHTLHVVIFDGDVKINVGLNDLVIEN